MRYLFILILISTVSLCQAEVVTGNIHGKVTLVEYFDYNCPVCRGFSPTINQLMASNPELKVIQKVVPVLAPTSVIVDSAVLASFMQSQFNSTESAVLSLQAEETIPLPLLANTLKRVGLNMVRLNHDMQSKAIVMQLHDNLKEYHQLGLHQIPVIQIYHSSGPSHTFEFVGSQPLGTLQRAITFTLNQHGEYDANKQHP